MIVLALALSSQSVPAVHEFPAQKAEQQLTNKLSCTPSGKFLVDLRWRFRHGLIDATVKRGGVALPRSESKKLIITLNSASDLLYIQMGCSGSHDAVIQIAYIGRENGRPSPMMLGALIHSDSIQLDKTTQWHLIP